MLTRKQPIDNVDRPVTRAVLIAFVEQIEAVFTAIDDLGEDKRSIYGAAHDAGIEKTALGKVVAFRRQRGKDPAKFDQQDALVQQYLGLLNGEVDGLEAHTRIRAREIADQVATRTEFFERILSERAEGYPRRGENSVVYFLHAEAAGTIKIGVTNDIDRRLGDLMRMSPLALKLLLTIPGTHKKEGEFHQRFASCRLHGEWFSTTDGAILDFIAAYVPAHDPDTGEIIEPAHPPAAVVEANPLDIAEEADGARVEPASSAPIQPETANQSTAARMDVHQGKAGTERVDNPAPLTQQGFATPDSLGNEVGRPQSATLQSEAGARASYSRADTLDPAGTQARPVDTNSEPNLGELGETPAQASEPAEEGGAGASASSVALTFLAVEPKGTDIPHMGDVR